MSPQGHHSNDVSRIYGAALELPESDRLAYLRRECAGDEALQREVESLLAWNADVAPLIAALAGEPVALPVPTASTTLSPEGPVHQAVSRGTGEQRLTAGTIIAGRFRIVAAVGRGGMGEVYRADDLELGQTVALKFLTAFQGDATARDRLRAEVRVARQITHPNVCRVYDIGESDGRLYLTMEYVSGEDLAALLRRVGYLGREKTLEIGRKIAAGLAAAHARGIVHRDLKPHNIMIDDDGEVRIMDFGIAVVAAELRGTETLRGTPAYMAPEQLVGRDISAQSDIYALGLVLYELCTGKRPVDASDRQELLRLRQSAPPVKPSALVPDLDPSLERVILRCLDPDQRRRPASADSVARELSGEPPLKKRWKSAALIGAVAIVVGLAAVTYVRPSWLAPRSAAALTNRDALVVADFENQTGEPLFDGALKVALAVALEQSPFLSIYPEARARDTLRLMERSPDAPITRAVAREIAQREQVKALLAGSITRLGGNYAVAVEAIDAVTGDVLAREQVEAAGKEQVVASLSTVASRLREKLGESLASIQRFDVPLPRATTASLDALHAYALALEESREVPRLETIPHLKRAIELDPTFALAYAQLSSVYANNGQTLLAPPFSRKAFELRDRVSERERFFISWRYYSDAERSWDEALELARSWTESYPQEAFAFNSLGLARMRFGQFEQAIAAYSEARRLDPGLSVVYGNLGVVFRALDRRAEAQAVLKMATDRQIYFGNVRPTLFSLAFLDGDDASMERMVKEAGEAEADSVLGGPARVLAYRGRVRTAREQFRRGILSAEQRGLHQTAATLTLQSAEIDAIAGECRDVSGGVGAGLALTRGYEELVRASRTLALCGAARGATDLLNELSEQFPQAYLLKRVHRPVIEALITLRRGEAARAIALLDPVRPLDDAPEGERWPAYLRGLAYAQAKDWAAATSEFQRLVDHRGLNPMSPLHPLARLGLARGHGGAGRTSEARTDYETLFGMWTEADPDLALLRDARAEHARLR
ncbi:MAG TPA: protein kinase [Vicinamibacterales bacterium]|nr:protein kinase [Vicinamibacterales bacterium]